MRPRLYSSADEVTAAIATRVKLGCAMMTRDVQTLADYARLRAELQNWEALNYTFLSGNFFNKSFARNYYSLIETRVVTDVVLEGAIRQLRDRIEQQLNFLASLSAQLIEAKEEGNADTLGDLIALASATARNSELLRAS